MIKRVSHGQNTSIIIHGIDQLYLYNFDNKQLESIIKLIVVAEILSILE